jgi:hypothetical protein
MCGSDIVFEIKEINDSIVLIKVMCHWITNWTILQIKEEYRMVLMLRARLKEPVANEVYRASQTCLKSLAEYLLYSFPWCGTKSLKKNCPWMH